MKSTVASVFATVLAVSAAVYACGGGSDSSASDAGASDATATDGGADVTNGDGGSSGDDSATIADALPDINQDPNVYPAMHHPIPLVDRGPGPVIDHMKIVTVTFVGDANRDTYRAFDQAIGGTSWWQSTLMPYGLSPSQVIAEVELPDTFSGTTTDDSALRTYFSTQIESGVLPPPDGETLYVVYATRTMSVTLSTLGSSCSGFEGYHDAFATHVPPPDGGAADAGPTAAVTAAYAMVFDCFNGGINGITSVASHEIAEAATDPDVDMNLAYYMETNAAWLQQTGTNPMTGAVTTAGEVGDLCVDYDVTEGSYVLQRIYSNAAAALSENPCQPTSTTYFGGAVRTSKALTNGILADGFVSVKPGESTDVLIDVFSQAALPSDLTLSVGGLNFGGGVQLITTGVTTSLSNKTVHNGDGVVLTINAASTVAPGRYPFVVRAELSASDTNDWPVILIVQ
jgi:hypothetical protein